MDLPQLYLATFCAFVILLSSCNIASDPGRVDYGPFTVMSSGDIPLKVSKSAAENAGVLEIVEVRRYGSQPHHWFEVEYSDGSTRKFKSDGNETFFGVL